MQDSSGIIAFELTASLQHSTTEQRAPPPAPHGENPLNPLVTLCRLERLELTFCGRGLTESTAAALAAAGPLHKLHMVVLRGAYRLTDAALCSILRNTSNLQVLRLPQNSLLTGESIQQLPSLVPLLRCGAFAH